MKLSHFTLVLFLMLLTGCGTAAQEEHRPNILIILADDQGKADPYEKNNVIAEHPEIVNDLQQKYTAWRGEMGTPMGGSN